MKSLKYSLIISTLVLAAGSQAYACGPYYPYLPGSLKVFRSCAPELVRQWNEGCRFQEYEKEENCLLWQTITSADIPLRDIENVVYTASLADLQGEHLDSLARENKFARWLARPSHSDDLGYIRLAKEIEEIRRDMNNPWYYAYDGDEEHTRLNELRNKCLDYSATRHQARYALQLTRLYFATADFKSCIDLWESSVSNMPQDIITKMIASYAGGAYLRTAQADKAEELYIHAEDIGSLINMHLWEYHEDKPEYTVSDIKEMEYIFNRIPDSPLLAIKLQECVRRREEFVADYEEWKQREFHDPTPYFYYIAGDSMMYDDGHTYFTELKRFAHQAAASPATKQKGMWNYALGFLYYLEGNYSKALTHLNIAENSRNTPLIDESIRTFRILMNSTQADGSPAYRARLLKDLQWLDERLARDVKLKPDDRWQGDNKMNYPFYYWQDAVRRIFLGEACPRLLKAGQTQLAMQLANYASNRIHQLSPLYCNYTYDYDDGNFHSESMTFDVYRKSSELFNDFDYSSPFFDMINNLPASEGAKYVAAVTNPRSELDKFLNERTYVDSDYLNEIVGTLYLREMNYAEAARWLARVSTDYQARTNVAKEGHLSLDPFQFQLGDWTLINDQSDYKLRFAQEMLRLESLFRSDAEPNRRADAKIRYAIGLRNSFGKCWPLTAYAQSEYYDYKGNEGYYYSYDHTYDHRYSFDREGNAKKAYEKVDILMDEGLAEFTDPEKAARANLEMRNFATVMKLYPATAAADRIRGKCDTYLDYHLNRR